MHPASTLRLLLFIVACCIVFNSHALDLSSLSEKESVGGLKEALTQGTAHAVSTLGKTNGFLGNLNVRIPLPESLQKTEKFLRAIGQGQQLDALLVAMNRAAEASVPQAKKLLIDAVKSMSIDDARRILNGHNDAATQYFKSKTWEPLSAQFLPIVRQTTSKLRLSDQYNKVAGQGIRLGLIEKQDATIEQYVTRKALDGLYWMIAEEEKNIRQHPAAALGSLAKKVFGTLSQ